MRPMIPIDRERTRQELDLSYNAFVDLSYVVVDPTRINIDGTGRIG